MSFNLLWNKFFTMLIFGIPSSGKSHLLKSIIYNASKKSQFDHCILLCATKNSPDYTYIPDEYKYDAFDVQAIENYLNFCKKHNENKIKTRGLIIMDDICGDMHFKGDLMKKLFCNYRHYGLSIIVCSQVIIDIPPYLRSIIKYGCIYKYVNENDRDKIYNCFGSLAENKQKFLQLYDKYTDEQYKFLFYSQSNMYDRENCYCGVKAPKKIPNFKLDF